MGCNCLSLTVLPISGTQILEYLRRSDVYKNGNFVSEWKNAIEQTSQIMMNVCFHAHLFRNTEMEHTVGIVHYGVYLSWLVNCTAADDLSAKRIRAWTAIILAYFSSNIPVSVMQLIFPCHDVNMFLFVFLVNCQVGSSHSGSGILPIAFVRGCVNQTWIHIWPLTTMHITAKVTRTILLPESVMAIICELVMPHRN